MPVPILHIGTHHFDLSRIVSVQGVDHADFMTPLTCPAVSNRGDSALLLEDVQLHFARADDVRKPSTSISRTNSVPSFSDGEHRRRPIMRSRSSKAVVCSPHPMAIEAFSPQLSGSFREGLAPRTMSSAAAAPMAGTPRADIVRSTVTFAPDSSPKPLVHHPTHQRAKSAFPTSIKTDSPAPAAGRFTMEPEHRNSMPTPVTTTPTARAPRDASINVRSPSPPSRPIHAMVDLATSLPFAALDQFKTHRRELSKMITEQIKPPFYDVSTQLGEIPLPGVDYIDGDNCSFADVSNAPEHSAFVDEFVRRVHATLLGSTLPAACPAHTRRGYAFTIDVPTNAMALLKAADAHKRPAKSDASLVHLLDDLFAFDEDSARAANTVVDVIVSVQWNSQHLVYPVVAQFRMPRALIFCPEWVVCARVAQPIKPGRDVHVTLTITNCTTLSPNVTLVFRRPQLVASTASDAPGHVVAGGLEWVESRMPVGECCPNLPRTVTAHVRAFQPGTYDISHLELHDATNIALHSRFIGGIVHVCE